MSNVTLYNGDCLEVLKKKIMEEMWGKNLTKIDRMNGYLFL